MKKRLEAELISIAHRILKLKNKSEVDQLYKETQKLYEALSVLKFYQDNFESVKADVAQDVLEEKVSQSLENEVSQQDVVEIKEEVIAPEATVEEVVEEAIAPEVDEEEPVFKPIFELEVEEEEEDLNVSEEEEEIEPAETASEVRPGVKQVSLSELLGENYADTVFVKPNEVSLFSTDTSTSEEAKETEEEVEPKPASLNTAFSKSIEIGLNDRVAFVNNLFGESNEDFNRVLSQLNTFDTYEEAKNFINEMVIPDYNYWVGKEDYIERFMEVVEKKFN